MTKTEFINRLAKRMGCQYAEADSYFEHCIETLKGILLQGEELTLPGFGKFSVVEKPARQARNPKTGGMLAVEAKHVPLFKAGDAFKLRIRNHLKK